MCVRIKDHILQVTRERRKQGLLCGVCLIKATASSFSGKKESEKTPWCVCVRCLSAGTFKRVAAISLRDLRGEIYCNGIWVLTVQTLAELKLPSGIYTESHHTSPTMSKPCPCLICLNSTLHFEQFNPIHYMYKSLCSIAVVVCGFLQPGQLACGLSHYPAGVDSIEWLTAAIQK